MIFDIIISISMIIWFFGMIGLGCYLGSKETKGQKIVHQHFLEERKEKYEIKKFGEYDG